VRHELGETEVPLRPERVVALDTTPLEAALAVGVEPVGAPIIGEGFSRHLRDRLGGVEGVGTPEEPNLEAIAALNPDLILCGEFHESVYEELAQISPAVADGSTMEDWKADMRLDARALGREEEMERELAAYEERVARFEEAMGERLDEITVSLTIFYPDSFRIYLPGSFMGQVVEEAGLRRPEHQMALITDDNDFAADPSNERLPLVDAGVMFTMRQPEDEVNYLDKLEEEQNPLYRNLEVVEDDRVYEVLFDVWLAGRGIISANLILDDLEKYLLEGAP
jgi:iron complex transport system substrate-binding protein